MYKLLLGTVLSTNAIAGPYIELGLGTPLYPDTGYVPDTYGIASFGYAHHVDEIASLDMGFVHRSVTGADFCDNDNNTCYGDNAIEVKLRFEFK